jgi:HK97 gp10 family phage protein
MAYTMKVEGLEEISEQLNKLGEKAQGIASLGLYEGAGVMSEEINKAADGIKTAPFHYAVFITRDPSPEEKAVVLAGGAGIAKFNKNGSEVNTSIGYARAGYAELNGKQVPIPKIANAINSGTSFMKKQPFFRKAVSSGTGKASEKIIKKIEEAIDEITK